MTLQGALRSFCLKSGWCYAVLWKFKCQDRMVLNWEDGFYKCEPPDSCDTSCFEIRGSPLQNASSVSEASYWEGLIGRAITKMTHCAHFMGEGIIGHVALSGKYQWVFADGKSDSELAIASENVENNQKLEKYPSSWDSQFAAGIKTIAIIAVPQGVVQLGSTQRIMENIELVNHVKSAFGALQIVPGAVQAIKPLATELQSLTYGLHGESGDIEEEFSGSKALTIEGPTEAFHAIPHRPVIGSDLQILGTFSPASQLDMTNQPISLSNKNLVTSHAREMSDMHSKKSSTHTPPFISSCKRILGLEAYVVEPTCLHNSILPEDCTALNQLNVDTLVHNEILDPERCFASVSGESLRQSKVVASNLVPALKLNSSVSVTASNYNMPQRLLVDQDPLNSLGAKTLCDSGYLLGSTFDDVSQSTYSVSECHDQSNMDPIPHSGITDEKDLGLIGKRKSSKHVCSFEIGDELSQALGLAFSQVDQKDDTSKKARTTQQTPGRAYGLQEQSIVDIAPNWGSSFVNEEWPFLESRPEPLLDAVVANASISHHSASTIADDILSSRTYSGMESEMSVPNTMKEASFKRTGCNPSSQDCLPQDFVKAFPTISGVDAHTSKKMGQDTIISFNSSCHSPLKSILSSWTEDMQSMKSDSTQASQSKKPENLSKVSRKRARPGESTRPRPKDRQQIQDRVRELREIVPNGSKCSIDALLEKTIKHMLFLQNVTRHADNLKKNGELNDDVESGASWAFELHGGETGHPILVKNLDQPRTLLVEMFCEEKSHFLEIADVIRNLGLSILKGVMESRSEKTWARFIVEANRDVHRVDVMMSLMHFLHVNDNNTSSMTVASQLSIPHRSQQTTDSSSSSRSHTQAIRGFPQHSHHP